MLGSWYFIFYLHPDLTFNSVLELLLGHALGGEAEVKLCSVKFYIDIYLRISLEDRNLGTFKARKDIWYAIYSDLNVLELP